MCMSISLCTYIYIYVNMEDHLFGESTANAKKMKPIENKNDSTWYETKTTVTPKNEAKQICALSSSKRIQYGNPQIITNVFLYIYIYIYIDIDFVC